MCSECGRISGHDCRCPNYTYPATSHHCKICDEGIYDNEEYLVNQDGEYIHYDCIQGFRELIDWLGYEVKTMGELYD